MSMQSHYIYIYSPPRFHVHFLSLNTARLLTLLSPNDDKMEVMRES